MKYFIIDEFGVKHPYPYDEDGGGIIDTAAKAIEYIYIAGANVSIERVLMLSAGKVVHFDPSDENNAGKVVGISKNSALVNENVTVVAEGVMTSPGWGRIANSIYYAAANGTTTTTIPGSGILQSVGVAIDVSTMKISFSEPIILT